MNKPPHARDSPSESLGEEVNNSTLRESFKQSNLAHPVRIDSGNEELRAQINALQYELDSLQQDREVALLRHQQELREVEARAEIDFKRAQAAEAQAVSATNKHITTLREMQEALASTENEKSALERKVRSLTEETNRLREEIEQTQETSEALERERARKNSELEARQTATQKAFEEIQLEVEAKCQTIQESKQKIVDQETELERIQKELLQLKGDGGVGSREMQVLKREFSEQVELVRTLEIKVREQQAELKRLRERNTSIEVLQEEKRDLENKVRLMDGLRLALTESQLRQELLEDERRSWAAYLESQQDTDGNQGVQFDSPEEMARAFMKLRIENVSLLDKMGVLRPELATRDDKIRELEEKTEKLEGELEELRAKSTILKTSSPAADRVTERKAIVRLERQKNLAVKEVEYLRAQLLAMDLEQSELEPDKYDSQRGESIRELQKLLDEYRSEAEEARKNLAQLEARFNSEGDAEPHANNPDVSHKRKRVSSGLDDYDKLVELRQQNRELTNKIAQLEQTNRETSAELQAQILQLKALREASKTRVLQLRDNPTAQMEGIKMNTLRLLREENRALLAQLAKMTPEEGGKEEDSSPSSSLPLVPIESLEALRDELGGLREEVASKEKRNTRRMQVFAAKAAEFREAVASILGWKMDFMPNGRVKVTSMFYPGDEEQERSIVFDGENGTMKVSGGPKSEFAGEIRSLIEFWVEGKKEIPCFLAAMTLEFYERFSRTS